MKRDFPINESSYTRKKYLPKEIAQVVWNQYDKDGHGSQGLEEINKRGGFGWYEMVFYLYSRILELTDVEKVADFMHDQWSHWMKYLFSKMVEIEDYTTPEGKRFDGFTFKYDDRERWKDQMHTPYAELSEKEKDSDREWARKLLEVIK